MPQLANANYDAIGFPTADSAILTVDQSATLMFTVLYPKNHKTYIVNVLCHFCIFNIHQYVHCHGCQEQLSFGTYRSHCCSK